MHNQIDTKEIEVKTSYKRTLMLVATSLLLAACGQTDPVDMFVQNAPEEEAVARKEMVLLLRGDFTGLYQASAERTRKTEEQYIAGLKRVFGRYPEHVKNCGGLDAIEVFEKTERKPGEHYRLIYRVYLKDKDKAECKPGNFMPMHAIKTAKGWEVRGE